MSEDVGKVSLGLELDAGDISKQLGDVGSKIGNEMSKHLKAPFAAAFKSLDMKKLTGGLGEAVKGASADIMKGFAAGVEAAIQSTDASIKKSIAENKVVAEQAIDAIQTKLNAMKPPSIFSKLSPAFNPAPGASTAQPAGQAIVKPVKAAPKVDVAAAKVEMEQLTSVLDNVNAKIDVQERKLAKLKESLASAFNETRKNRLSEQIVNTEGTLIRLTNQSNQTSAKIWKLEDRLKNAGNAASQVNPPVQKLGSHLTKMDKPLKSAAGNLDKATRAAAGVGREMNKASGSAGRMGNSMTQALGRVAKQVFVFALLYKAIRGFSSYVGGMLSTNQQFMASLNAVRTNLAVAFQPIYQAILPALNALMSWLAKATAYIAAFISAIFGTTYKQSYAAAKGIETAKKAMEGFGKKAKKAGKDAKKAAATLAGFDELNTLDFSKGPDADDPAAGGGGGPKGFEMEMPDLDIDGIQGKMDALVAGIKSTFAAAWTHIKAGWGVLVQTFGPSFQTAWASIKPVLGAWKTEFGSLFRDIQAHGEPLKNWFTNDLVPLWQKGIVIAGEIVAGLLGSLLSVFQTMRATLMPIWSWFIIEGLPILTQFVSGGLDILRGLFQLVKQIFDDIWRGVVDPAMKLVSKIVIDILNALKAFWNTWGKDIMAGLQTTVDKLKSLWKALWESFLKPITQSALKFLTDLWDKHLKGLVTEVLDFVGKVAKAALDILNKFVLPIVTALIKGFGPVFAEVFDGILRIVGAALGGIIDAAKGIIKALGGIVEFIAGVFTGDWKRAWEGIKTFMKGIGDAIVGIFKGAINAIIEAMNWMTRQISKISIDIPDWVPKVGGETLGFKIPEIPKLAKGGLAFGPTLAMVGDNRGASADPEVISPLSKLQAMMDQSGGQGMNDEVVAAIYTMINVFRDYADRPVVLEANGTQLARATTNANNDRNRRSGRTLAMP